ncbi:MAG TPA: helix-turn-helix transcriptional regulator [Salinimicrobium sp.]|nr:helix-turn-helix transcriptional regulator [Salinimicrobium sp.]
MEKKISRKIRDFAQYAELMPGVVIIHDTNTFSTVYMSSNGLEGLGISLSEIQEMGADYHNRFFNNEDMSVFIIKLSELLQKGRQEETFTFFQQVKLKDRQDWAWHLCSTRIFHIDEDGNPTHIITIAIPIENMKHISHKAERLLAQNMFFQKNMEKFLSLGKREKEILQLVAMGKTSSEIAKDLNISVETVSTHRKVIKHKLGVSNTYEFIEYAQAFDLI